MRETLKVIENFSGEQMKDNLERKVKVEKMDKLIGDLSEKCQGMQQALLYKEEKYDEKCREVERYKVICELSAKAAVSDEGLYYGSIDVNNNDHDNNNYDNCDKDISNSFLGPENEQNLRGINLEVQDGSPNIEGRKISQSRITKGHTKLRQGQMHLSNYVEPMRPLDDPSERRPLDDEAVHQGELASYYVGGPCKRKPKRPDESVKKLHQDIKFRDRLANIGGINVSGPRIPTGPVPIDQLNHRSESLLDDYQNKRVKIALVGQSNEVMSSSRNAIYQTKQKFTEKDLHRQVARGCWSRLTSRRKKEWPY